MYTLLLNNDHSFIQSERQVLMQHSSLVDTIHILVPYIYDGVDMRECTCTMEYVKPVSRKYMTETLIPEEELYKTNYVEYKIPLTSKLSEEAGKIELQLTFTKSYLDEDGNKKFYDRKTQSTIITITPITNWSDLITDESLTALDNRILAIDGQIRALNELQGDISTKIPNDLKLTEDLLQLSIDGETVGNGVQILVVDSKASEDDEADGEADGLIDIDKILDSDDNETNSPFDNIDSGIDIDIDNMFENDENEDSNKDNDSSGNSELPNDNLDNSNSVVDIDEL